MNTMKTKMSKSIVLAFDVYGTLLSTQSIADKLASHFGGDTAKTIATTWRRYQLEYTWRMNSMGQYEDFSKVTQRSLKHALHESKVSLNDEQTTDMMKSYDSLTCFPDIDRTMKSLHTAPDIKAVIFSNGTHSMVSSSINNSPDLAKHAKSFDDIVVVEEVKKYKPHPEVYYHLAKKVGKDTSDSKQMEQVWVVSGNPFDIVGARAVGMNAIWVDRMGIGWQDSMVEGSKGRPTEVVKTLDSVVTSVMSTHSDELTSQWREMHGEREKNPKEVPPSKV
ncbi:haloacid dehalogenase [Hortaea werneckii]|nr:haloacid dehalogenase [Hortaea werneckii]